MKRLLPVALALTTVEMVGGFLLWRSGARLWLVMSVLLGTSLLARWQGKQLKEHQWTR